MPRTRYLARRVLPEEMRDRVKGGLFAWQQATRRVRVLPDYLIIGGQKCGTSSLFYYLQQHPNVILPPCITKEPHFFNTRHYADLDWYSAHFPTRLYRTYRSKVRCHRVLTGEATPEYLFHPKVAERVAKVLPNVMLIVLLRDPVRRAFSHWNMQRRRGVEPLGFEEALDAEEERIAVDRKRMIDDPDYWGEQMVTYSYRLRGCYLEQLLPFYRYFSPDHLLILNSEQMFADPLSVYLRTLDFLGLPPSHRPNFDEVGAGDYEVEMSIAAKQRLQDYYRCHNERLFRHLDAKFDWEQDAAS